MADMDEISKPKLRSVSSRHEMRAMYHLQHATNGGNDRQEINIVYLRKPHLAMTQAWNWNYAESFSF